MDRAAGDGVRNARAPGNFAVTVPDVRYAGGSPAPRRGRTRMAARTPPLKWHGGKRYLAPKIVALMPPHLHYVEPYAGGLAVLLARDPNDPRLWKSDASASRGVSEVVNDLNGRLTNFLKGLQCESSFTR